jgi:hypothetical protein
VPVIHRSGVAFVVEHGVHPPGKNPVKPSTTPDAVDVLNHTLNPRLVVEGVTIRLLPVAGMHELVVAAVHHAPSIGIYELDPLKPVALTPATGPDTPSVVFISIAGGFTVVRSLTGT